MKEIDEILKNDKKSVFIRDIRAENVGMDNFVRSIE